MARQTLKDQANAWLVLGMLGIGSDFGWATPRPKEWSHEHGLAEPWWALIDFG